MLRLTLILYIHKNPGFAFAPIYTEKEEEKEEENKEKDHHQAPKTTERILIAAASFDGGYSRGAATRSNFTWASLRRFCSLSHRITDADLLIMDAARILWDESSWTLFSRDPHSYVADYYESVEDVPLLPCPQYDSRHWVFYVDSLHHPRHITTTLVMYFPI